MAMVWFFKSPDGKIRLMAWGSRIITPDEYTLDTFHDDLYMYLGYEPVLDVKRDNYVVFSGYKVEKIVYEKHILKSDKTENAFLIEYPIEDKEKMDDIVTHLAYNIFTGVGLDSESPN